MSILQYIVYFVLSPIPGQSKRWVRLASDDTQYDIRHISISHYMITYMFISITCIIYNIAIRVLCWGNSFEGRACPRTTRPRSRRRRCSPPRSRRVLFIYCNVCFICLVMLFISCYYLFMFVVYCFSWLSFPRSRRVLGGIPAILFCCFYCSSFLFISLMFVLSCLYIICFVVIFLGGSRDVMRLTRLPSRAASSPGGLLLPCRALGCCAVPGIALTSLTTMCTEHNISTLCT